MSGDAGGLATNESATRLTIAAFRVGQGFSAALFSAAVVMHFLGSDVAERAAQLGVLGLVATPALALAATIAETWPRDRRTAFIAAAVLVVLGVATAIAVTIAGR